MRLKTSILVLALSLLAFPTMAKVRPAPATSAMDDLRRLPPGEIIPAIRLEGAMKHDQILCLALAMYHEARGATEAERTAVAQVVYNRALHTDATVCATVWADHGSQFQWVKSSATIVPREVAAWAAVQGSAVRFMRHRPTDSTQGATYFFNPALCSPDWAKAGHVTVRLQQAFLRIDGKHDRFSGPVSASDPISQLDQLGRRRATRTYFGGAS